MHKRRRNRAYFAVVGYLYVIGPGFMLDIKEGTGLRSGEVVRVLQSSQIL